MTKWRLIMFVLTIFVVSFVGTFAILYARGYRLGVKENNLEISPRGLLVANSDPNGAQVIVNGELKTATNATLSLSPGEYTVIVKKEGFIPWQKQITIRQEEVTQIDVFLIQSAPSLTPLTFTGVFNPQPTVDLAKIAYGVYDEENPERSGLWILETVNLPLGFNRDPRRITDGDLTAATWEWSPDGREILLTTKTGTFLLPTGEYTPATARVNVTKLEAVHSEWKEKQDKQLASQVTKLPDEFEATFKAHATDIAFSPDETRILYTASGTATIAPGVVKPFPGSSTQKEERTLSDGMQYVYDLKEDRNFAVGGKTEKLYWLANSLNVVSIQETSISVLDYDGTNRQVVFAGSFSYPHAYPSTNPNRLMILTNFGSKDSLPNLYWLSLK